MSLKQLKGRLVFDFDFISFDDYLETEKAYQNNDPDRVFIGLSKIVTQWPFEGEPSDINSWENLDAVSLMLVHTAISQAVADAMVEPHSYADVRVDITKWNGRKYMKFANMLQTGNYTEALPMLEEVTEYEGVDINKGIGSLTLEQFIRVLQSVRYELKEAFEGN